MSKPNTKEHEILLADTAKGMTEGLLKLTSIIMEEVVAQTSAGDAGAEDGRTLYLIDCAQRMSDMAANMYKLGERARHVAKGLDWEPTK